MLLIAVSAYNQMLSKSIAEQKIRMEKMISTHLRKRERGIYEQERIVVYWDLYLLKVAAEIRHPEICLAHDSSMTQSHRISVFIVWAKHPIRDKKFFKTQYTDQSINYFLQQQKIGNLRLISIHSIYFGVFSFVWHLLIYLFVR